MKAGKLPYHNLKTSVIGAVKRVDDSKSTPKVGMDASIVNTEGFSEGTGDTPLIAWIKALNNVSTLLPKGIAARVLMLLTKADKDSSIKAYMEEFSALSKAFGIQITGGNSEVLEGLCKPKFIVTMLGSDVRIYPDKKSIKPGFDIVMAGYAGELGTNVLVDKFSDKMTDRFSRSFLEGARFFISDLSIDKKLLEAYLADTSIFYAHDGSGGGIYKALFELSEFTGRGIEIENKAIPIRQETIEICDFLDINPYMIDASGAVLLVTDRARDIVEKLSRKGYPVAIIGKVTDKKEKLVALNSKELRVLEPGMEDELQGLIY